MTELPYGITLFFSVTCHLTQVDVPFFNSSQVGWHYLPTPGAVRPIWCRQLVTYQDGCA